LSRTLHPYRMAWSFRIGRILGIDVKVHFVFVLLIAWLSMDEVFEAQSLLAGAEMLFVLLLLFSFVLLHELGHSIAAQHCGIRVKDITLWPLGGLARLDGQTNDPKTELLISVAGPAVNLILVLLAWPLMFLTREVDNSFLKYLPEFCFWANLIMGGFNLAPAFPMDGGRILRSLLGLKMSLLRATEIAVSVGRILAFTTILMTFLYGSPFSNVVRMGYSLFSRIDLTFDIGALVLPRMAKSRHLSFGSSAINRSISSLI